MQSRIAVILVALIGIQVTLAKMPGHLLGSSTFDDQNSGLSSSIINSGDNSNGGSPPFSVPGQTPPYTPPFSGSNGNKYTPPFSGNSGQGPYYNQPTFGSNDGSNFGGNNFNNPYKSQGPTGPSPYGQSSGGYGNLRKTYG
ncbi:hypothetical protein WR25_02382 [Diploscapter pachys]|uniref:Uncharacterized protein n=1 Tax=Diploscapter pachys TaxID=2018661 RepID=A0A2A2LME1_9BILA|nr:hypothetical protein WR25_02382 [Diploscapter pachys]